MDLTYDRNTEKKRELDSLQEKKTFKEKCKEQFSYMPLFLIHASYKQKNEIKS